jgi:hypothetical protein
MALCSDYNHHISWFNFWMIIKKSDSYVLNWITFILDIADEVELKIDQRMLLERRILNEVSKLKKKNNKNYILFLISFQIGAYGKAS